MKFNLLGLRLIVTLVGDGTILLLDRSPQQNKPFCRPSEDERRPRSPEKPRDYTSPSRKTQQPAVGRPSRPEEKSVTFSREPDEEPTRAKEAQKPGKPDRAADKPDKPRRPRQDDKPIRGDQIPDEGTLYPGTSVPDVLSKVPLKEQCICELCTCG